MSDTPPPVQPNRTAKVLEIVTSENPIETAEFYDLSHDDQAIIIMKLAGTPGIKIAERIGITPETVSRKLNGPLKDIQPPTNKILMGKANAALIKLLDGETWGEIDKIKDSTALGAAKLVIDMNTETHTEEMSIGEYDLGEHRKATRTTKVIKE